MSTNDRIILDQILEQQHPERAPSASPSEFFEMFVAEQVLKGNDLSFEELESGLTGSGGDGGIDAMYVLVNGELAHEDIDLSPLKKNVLIEVVVIQAKLSESFGESAIEKLIGSAEDIFNLTKDLGELRSVYNEGVLVAAEIFRMVYKGLAAKFPTLKFNFHYASRGSEVHPNVTRKAAVLREKVEGLFSNAECAFSFLGAPQLLKLARLEPPRSHELALAENPISSAGEVGYICLVRIRDYDKFIRGEDGRLRRNLFEANVRDYQGSTTVNEEIADSLRSNGGEDFWWLNNGVTIVANKATQSGKALTLEDPQIVNGLQTSTEIFRHFSENALQDDDRNVLVRVIVPKKAESRDRVIKATNSQTYIPPASLRATDKIHRDIEEYLKPFGLFYDRRKNFHKNNGRPIEAIIGIPLMAQAVMSVLLQRPDDARARPSSLLKEEGDYTKVFSTSYPIEIYRICASIIKKVDAHFRSTSLDARTRNNLRFYVAMHIGATLSGDHAPSAKKLGALDVDAISDAIISCSVAAVSDAYDRLGGSDRVAKGPTLGVCAAEAPHPGE